jgi:hypothetical protein
MTDPLWDEFDQVERNAHRPRVIAVAHLQPCAEGDHTPVTVRPYGGLPIFTACTTCGLRLPFNPDA